MEQKEIILQAILEGFGLGALLILVCALGIRKGAVGMVHLFASLHACNSLTLCRITACSVAGFVPLTSSVYLQVFSVACGC